MAMILVALVVALNSAEAPADVRPTGASYQTNKSLAALQKCLTDKLSTRGDVTAIAMPDGTTLMLRESDGDPMLIDLEPPSVKVTTRFASGTRTLVEHCI